VEVSELAEGEQGPTSVPNVNVQVELPQNEV